MAAPQPKQEPAPTATLVVAKTSKLAISAGQKRRAESAFRKAGLPPKAVVALSSRYAHGSGSERTYWWSLAISGSSAELRTKLAQDLAIITGTSVIIDAQRNRPASAKGNGTVFHPRPRNGA